MKSKKILVLAVVLLILWPTQALAATLRLGSSGSEVVSLQQALREKGYFTYKSNTGYYGSITKDAVIRFQKDRRLDVDGIAGPQTQEALYSAPATESRAVLKYGMEGQDVVELQTKLKAAGFFNFADCTGYYGNITRNAVIDFQQAKGLSADGVAGPKTRGTLNTMVDASRGMSLDRDAMLWLSRIIHAESSGESYAGKVAVGNVILNRVRSSQFPNTVYDVIFEYYKGIPQFSPVEDGTIYNTPGASSVQAAEAACAGYAPVGASLYFFNPAKAAGTWIVNNRQYVTTIGGHAFYK